MSGPCIVTTLRNAGAVIDSFIAYHLGIGFSRLYLFFDDPNDPDCARLASHPSVTAIPHDAALRETWKTLPMYSEHADFLDSEVMSRQVLNVAHAMNLARSEGLSWLLHIDSDELFLSPGLSAAQHFAALDAQEFDTVAYKNFEALAEREAIGDYFREVTLFKVPPYLAQTRRYTTDELRSVIAQVPQFQPNFFHFYNSGKSAVRLSSKDMAPAGVHAFSRDEKYASGEANGQFILHYACCGFENFWTKYATLGRFADTWWGKHDIASSIGRFHLDARDITMTGDKDAARKFYRNRVALEDARLTEALIRGGFLHRFMQPLEILSAAFWKDFRA